MRSSIYCLSQEFRRNLKLLLCTSEVLLSAWLQYLAILRDTISLAPVAFLLICLVSNLGRKNTNWHVILERFPFPVLTHP